jgi:hypothetical protein
MSLPPTTIDNPTVVLVHGAFADSSSWNGVVAALLDDGFPVLALLLDAAKQLASLDVPLARETYLQAVSAAMFAGRLAQGDGLSAVAAAARAAPSPPVPGRAADSLLDAFALLFTEDARAATPTMDRALSLFLDGDASDEEELRWLWLAFLIAMVRWDDSAWLAIAERHLQHACSAGALTVLPLSLSARVLVHIFEGELTEAAELSDEVRTVTAAMGCGSPTTALWRSPRCGGEKPPSKTWGGRPGERRWPRARESG